MGWDGGGSVTLLYDFTSDRDAGSPSNVISATKFDAQFDDLATAIEACINLNGENTIASHINWGGYKITSLSDPAAATDAINASSVAENTVQYGGTTGGTANAQTVTNAFVASVGTGTRLLCLAGATNTGAATLNVNGAGAVAIVQRDGSTALTGGEIVSGDFFEVAYDGTSFVLISAIDLTQVNTLTITNSTDNASVQVMALHGDRATMADADEGYLSMYLSDDGGTQTEMARMSWIATDVTDTTEDGNLQWSVMIAGTLTDHMQLSSTALFPVTTDAIALGTSTLGFSDLFMDSGATINIDSGNWVATHSSGVLNVSTGSLQVGGTDVLAGTLTTSGNRWGVIPEIDASGYTEVGKYIDFHESDGDTDDADGRIYSSANVIYDGADNFPFLTGGRHSIFIPAAGMQPNSGSSSPATVTIGSAPMVGIAMGASAAEYARADFAMPKSWNQGVMAYKVYWAQKDAGTGNVVWNVEFGTWNDSAALANTFNSDLTVDGGGTAGDIYITAESDGVTLSSTTQGDECFMRVTVGRDAANASDTLGVDAYLLGVMIYVIITAKNDA